MKEPATQTKKKVNPNNGFSRNINILQILTYLKLSLFFFVFTVCVIPSYSNNIVIQVVASVLFYPLFLVVLGLGYFCTVHDPTDQNVILSKNAELNNESFDHGQLEFYCLGCKAHVSQQSKHCKVCDRCVEGFDHHCRWLNNCVNHGSYSYFFKLILALFLNMLVFLVFSIILIADFYVNSEESKLRNSQISSGASEILLWISSVLSLLVACFDANLVSFHIYLIRKKLTTYEFIINKRNQLKQVEEKKGKEVQNQDQVFPQETPSSTQIPIHFSVSRMDSLETTTHQKSKESPSKFTNQKKTCMEIICPCFTKRNHSHLKVAAVQSDLPKIDEGSEMQEDKEDFQTVHMEKQEASPEIKINERGLCASIDIGDAKQYQIKAQSIETDSHPKERHVYQE